MVSFFTRSKYLTRGWRVRKLETRVKKMHYLLWDEEVGFSYVGNENG